jgi:hypothetical protein
VRRASCIHRIALYACRVRVPLSVYFLFPIAQRKRSHNASSSPPAPDSDLTSTLFYTVAACVITAAASSLASAALARSSACAALAFAAFDSACAVSILE